MAFEWSVFPDDLNVATAVVVPRGSSHRTYDSAKSDEYEKKTVVYQSACLLADEFFCLFFSHLYSIFARETK